MLAVAGMTANTVWGQGIIHVSPQPQPFYNTMTFLDAFDTDLDINGDGVPDFTLHSTDVSLNYTWLIPLNGNLIAVTDNEVANMAVGDIVGADMAQYGWSDSTSLIGAIAVMFGGQPGGTPSVGGNFAGQTDGYIGFDLVEAEIIITAGYISTIQLII